MNKSSHIGQSLTKNHTLSAQKLAKTESTTTLSEKKLTFLENYESDPIMDEQQIFNYIMEDELLTTKPADANGIVEGPAKQILDNNYCETGINAVNCGIKNQSLTKNKISATTDNHKIFNDLIDIDIALQEQEFLNIFQTKMYNESNWTNSPVNNWQDNEKIIASPTTYPPHNKKDHSQCCSSTLDDINYEDYMNAINPNDMKLTALNNFDEKSYHFINGSDEMIPYNDDDLDFISNDDFMLHSQDNKSNSEHNYSMTNTFDLDSLNQYNTSYNFGINSAASSQEILVKDDPMVSSGLKYSQEIAPAKYPIFDEEDSKFSDFLPTSQKEQTAAIDKCLWNDDEDDSDLKTTAVIFIGKDNNLPTIIKSEKNINTFANINNTNGNIHDTEQTIMLSDYIPCAFSNNNTTKNSIKKMNNKRKKSSDSSSSIEGQSKKRKFDLKKRKASLKIELPLTNQSNYLKHLQEPHLTTPDICDEVLQLEEETLQNDIAKDMPSTNNQISSLTAENSALPAMGISQDESNDQLTSLRVKTYNRRSSRLSSSCSSVFKFDNPPSVQSTCTNEDLYASSIAPATPSSWASSEVAQRKKRGRPAKTHSEMPDPAEMQQLDEAGRRYRQQRYKNNEASRQSRLNRKQKEEQEKQEEQLLQSRNEDLLIEKEKWQRKIQKLQKLLCDEIGKLTQEKSV